MGFGVERGCYSEGRGEAELAGGQAKLLLLLSGQGVPVDTSEASFLTRRGKLKGVKNSRYSKSWLLTWQETEG